MENKKCPKCGQVKLITDFFRLKRSKDGLSYQCKECKLAWAKNNRERSNQHKAKWKVNNPEKVKEIHNKYYERKKDSWWRHTPEANAHYRELRKHSLTIVYCLPNYNKYGFQTYVGITNNCYYRMHQHKHVGNNTDEWFILDVFESRYDALEAEHRYHQLGHGGAKGHEHSQQIKLKYYI